MDFELNEQRVRDVEVPLHKLEQRVLQIEAQLNYTNNEDTLKHLCH